MVDQLHYLGAQGKKKIRKKSLIQNAEGPLIKGIKIKIFLSSVIPLSTCQVVSICT